MRFLETLLIASVFLCSSSVLCGTLLSETQSVDDVYYRVMHWMILDDFLRCVFDGSFNNKVVQNWKESPNSLSLSPHKKKRAPTNTTTTIK